MGTTQDLHRWQQVLLATVMVVLALTGVVIVRLIGQLRAANQAVSYDHAERVIDADGMEIAAFARSASARGYLLSGDPVFLERRVEARAEFQRRLDALRRRGGPGAALARIEQLTGQLDVASDRAIARYLTSPEAARATWDQEARPVQQALIDALGALVGGERVAFAAAREQAAEAWRSTAMLLAVLLGGVALLVGVLFYGYARVTRILVARQEAEQQQTTFRLLDQVPLGIFVLTAQGKPFYANRYAQQVLGRGVLPSNREQLSELYRAYEAGTDRLYPTDRLPVIRALAGEISECTDLEVRRGDEVVPLHMVGGPVRDARGQLIYAVAGFQDVRELRRLAMRDALTGLANRAALTQIFAREHAVSTRGRRPFSVGLIDLDRFKAINDQHGHAAGDEVLRRTAEAVVAGLRRSDAVGRWGGEEFVVLLPDTDVHGAHRALDKLLAAVRALAFHGAGGAAFSVTFSAGAVQAADGESLEQTVARADALLYDAKRAGRDRIHIAA